MNRILKSLSLLKKTSGHGIWLFIIMIAMACLIAYAACITDSIIEFAIMALLVFMIPAICYNTIKDRASDNTSVFTYIIGVLFAAWLFSINIVRCTPEFNVQLVGTVFFGVLLLKYIFCTYWSIKKKIEKRKCNDKTE